MMRMNLIMAVFFCLVSVAYLCFATTYSFGGMNDPRAGFLPILVGAAGLVLSLGNLVVVTVEEIRDYHATGQKIALNIPFVKKALWVVVAMLVYVYVMPLTGYLAASFLLLFSLMKIVGLPNWGKPVLLSAIFAGAFFLIFVVLLGVPLP